MFLRTNPDSDVMSRNQIAATGRIALVALLLAVLAGSLAAEDGQPPLPPALKYYKGREIAQTMHYLGAPWLIRESRQREEDTEQLLKVLNVQPGQVICDMGCGNGFYAIKLAKLAGPEGRVLAVDIQPEMLTLLKERAKAEGVENVQPILGTLIDPQLPKGSLDLILCVDVYHEFSHPEQMLAAMRDSLKPDGRVALVEFRAEDPDVPIKPLHKMSKDQILKEWRPNGFKLVEQYDQLPWQHVMFFQRAEMDTTP
jgi:ubiquinone/menaquinone biosynthesis C-methylase UbiE